MAVDAVRGAGLGGEGGVAALFDRPSRRCTELKGKIKTQGRIPSPSRLRENAMACQGLRHGKRGRPYLTLSLPPVGGFLLRGAPA